MRLLGADIRQLATGTVTLALPVRSALHQQHGFVHAGAIATLLDTACGFAALTVMDEGVGVLTAEYKVNLLRPAAGDVVGRGPGRERGPHARRLHRSGVGRGRWRRRPERGADDGHPRRRARPPGRGRLSG